MNRRELLLASLMTAAIPTKGIAQTPIASPVQHESRELDTRLRDLAGLLQTISPVELVDALQRTPVDDNTFGDALATPWNDFGDTDLFGSLGGAIVTAGDGGIHDADSEMLGGFIVYESAEIAYHEFVRKLGSEYDNPSTSTSFAGTTIWMLESDGLNIGTHVSVT